MADDTRSALVRKLERILTRSHWEREAVLALPLTARVVEADADIIREGDRPTQCCLVLEGFTCRYKSLPDGRRQILGFYIPGDIPDLQTLHLEVVDHSQYPGSEPPRLHPASGPAQADARPPPDRRCVLAGHAHRCGHLPGVARGDWRPHCP